MTCSVLNSSGAVVPVGLNVLNSSGTQFAISATILNSAGLPFIWCAEAEEGRAGAGGKRRRKPRFNIAQLRHEDEMILDMIKRFMNEQG